MEKKVTLLALIALLLCVALLVISCNQGGDNDDVNEDAVSGESTEDASSDTAEGESTLLEAVESQTEAAEGKTYLVSDFPDYSEYVNVGNYKGIEVAAVDASVTDEQIQDEIDAMLSDYTTYTEVTDRPVESGDVVNIDYTGYLDGTAFENGADTDFDLTIGSGAFIPGFEDAIIGHEVGTTFTIDVTFPEGYNEKLGGKETQFEIVLHSISEPNVPEYTDSFVQSVSEYATVAEFEAALREIIAEQNEEQKLTTIINAAWTELIGNTEILGYPEEEVDELVGILVDNYTLYATQAGRSSLEEYLTQDMNMTLDEFNANAEAYAQSTLSETMVIYVIAKAEGIEITAEDYAEGSAEYAVLYGFNTAAELEEYYGEELVMESLLWDKVLEFIAANAVEVSE